MHIDCVNIGEHTYSQLASSSNLWFCTECGVPNHSELIHSYNVSVSNTFAALNEDLSLDEYTELDSTIRSDTEPLVPQDASTPDVHRPGSLKTPAVRLLKIAVINFRNIVKNRDRLGVFLKAVNPDVILGSETHLEKGITTPTELAEYEVERRDRDTVPCCSELASGGGCLIAAKKELLMTREHELETDAELMFCKVNIAGSKTLHMGAFYRRDVSDNTGLGRLGESLSRIPVGHSTVLGGDFNLPGLTYDQESGPQLKPGATYVDRHETFLEMIADHNLTQHVTEITRVDPHHGTENVLDLAISNRPSSIVSSVVVPGVSDHDIPVIEMDVRPVRVTKKPRSVPQYKSAQWDKFSEFMASELNRLSPDSTLNAPLDTDPNLLWERFRDVIITGMNKFIPHRSVRSKLHLPYITVEIQKLIRRRDRLYDQIKKARKNVSYHGRASALHTRYKTLKRTIQTKIRISYWSFISNMIIPPDGSSTPKKAFWSFIRRNRTDNTSISTLKDLVTGALVTDPVAKANVLNAQFQSVFTRETPLTEEHKAEQEYPAIADVRFTVNGVRKLLENLDPTKAVGPDEIPPRVLKELASDIAPVLTEIFNRSYQTGVMPDDWRKANVVPAYKKGKKILAVNYRPISLTCICCKLFEHVMVSHIMGHLERHNALYKFQHGFRSRLSCESQLTEFYHDLVSNTYDGNQTDVLVMDFSKAFDKVGHQRLLEKVTRYGITGPTKRWVAQFLSGRTQTVVLDGHRSDTVPVTSGVPQGSVLGPCLFLLYINDMAEKLNCTVRLFADDTIAYLAIGGPNDAAALQCDLDLLASWEQTWQMEFHPDKCQVLRVSRKRKENVIAASYTLHGHTLKVVDHVKYLGVTLSGDLKWNHHIGNAVNKANSTLGMLKRNIKVGCRATKSAAYQALVRPHLEYSSCVWDPPPISDKRTKGLADKVEGVQRRAARWCFNKYRRWPEVISVSNLVKQLNWPLLTHRRLVARLALMYKMSTGMSNMAYRSLLVPHPYALRELHGMAYVEIDRLPVKLYYANSFFPRTVEQWNALPPDVFPDRATLPQPTPQTQLEAFKSSVWATLV